MIARAALMALNALPVQAGGAPIAGNPSGVALEVQELILSADVARLRLVAGGAMPDFGTIEPDLLWLCEDLAAWLAAEGRVTQEVVISIASAPVAFGDRAEGVTQFFEAFDYIDGHCQWKGL